MECWCFTTFNPLCPSHGITGEQMGGEDDDELESIAAQGARYLADKAKPDPVLSDTPTGLERYALMSSGDLRPAPFGEWVKAEDAAKLEADLEIVRLGMKANGDAFNAERDLREAAEAERDRLITVVKEYVQALDYEPDDLRVAVSLQVAAESKLRALLPAEEPRHA